MDKLYNVKDDLDSSKKKKGDTNLKGLPRNINLAKVKFEIYGEEMIGKIVKSSGNSGRVYLPPNWIGRHVKVIRVD